MKEKDNAFLSVAKCSKILFQSCDDKVELSENCRL